MESPIPVRIPADILMKIDAEGKRGTVINRILREYYDARPMKVGEARTVIHNGGASLYIRTTSEALAALKGLERRHDAKTCRGYKCGMCAAEK